MNSFDQDSPVHLEIPFLLYIYIYIYSGIEIGIV